MQRSATSLCSLETISEEPFAANEIQHVRSCLCLPSTPASDPKEGSVPENSRKTRAEGRDPSGQLKDVPLLPCPAEAAAEKTPPRTIPSTLSWEGAGQAAPPGDGRERAGGGGIQPGSQTQENVALVNCWVRSAGNCQKQRDGEFEERRSLKRTEKEATTMNGRPPQSLLDEQSTPAPPQLTQAAVIPRPHVVVRRSKSEGYNLCDCSVAARHPSGVSPAAEVYSDATVNDRIWSKLDANSHRDSMSSSSSMSSNDTVIDLSLPNLARKSLPDLGVRPEAVPQRRGVRPWSANAATGREMPTVTKSKSNPNLRSGQPSEDELCPRPLSRDPETGLAPIPRRHTWSRLYMESLKQSSVKSKDQERTEANQAKSKSLGDLTSDDIACTFDSKYRSISRGFVTRSMREQRRCGAARALAKPLDELTERLKKLTTFQQANDITSPTSLDQFESEEEEEGMGLLRRSSSRSQSRVRYIANRARQAQERQRLKNLALVNGSPIEERGNPEGACCFPRGACMDTMAPSLFTSQLKNPTDLKSCDPEVLFMYRL